MTDYESPAKIWVYYYFPLVKEMKDVIFYRLSNTELLTWGKERLATYYVWSLRLPWIPQPFEQYALQIRTFWTSFLHIPDFFTFKTRCEAVRNLQIEAYFYIWCIFIKTPKVLLICRYCTLSDQKPDLNSYILCFAVVKFPELFSYFFFLFLFSTGSDQKPTKNLAI